MSRNNPKVSIIIPVYNGANYMREAIESALVQTYKNIEVIVVNDGSNDNGATATVAKSFGEKVRYFEKPPRGVASALNFAIREMKGEYFSWLSHDDLYYPQKVERQVNLIEKYGREVIFYSDVQKIDEHSRSLYVRKIPKTLPENFLYLLISSGLVNGCSLLVPKICFEQIGLFNEELRATQDYDLWFRIAKKFRFIQVQEVLVKHRVHANQSTFVIPERYREINQLYISFLNEAKSSDIIKIPLNKKGVFFIKLALKLKKLYLNEPTCVAIQMAKEYKGKEKLFYKSVFCFLLFNIIILDLFQKIKKILMSNSLNLSLIYKRCIRGFPFKVKL